MPNPWDVPLSAPLRAGDRDESAIFLAVGKALTKWEIVEAELATIYAALVTSPDERYIAPAIRAFGTVTNTNARAEMIVHAAEAFFHLHSGTGQEVLHNNLKDILKHYRGWAGRRNDVAHGCSTESRHPDYTRDDQPIISTFSLCPSHGHSRKWWLDAEPAYHYIGREIDLFSAAFDELSIRVMDYATRLDEWHTANAGS